MTPPPAAKGRTPSERVGGGGGQAGPETRIEVVTEGVLTARMQRDPTLDGVAVVIFDEVGGDRGRALTAQMQRDPTLDGAAAVIFDEVEARRVFNLSKSDAPVGWARARPFDRSKIHGRSLLPAPHRGGDSFKGRLFKGGAADPLHADSYTQIRTHADLAGAAPPDGNDHSERPSCRRL